MRQCAALGPDPEVLASCSVVLYKHVDTARTALARANRAQPVVASASLTSLRPVPDGRPMAAEGAMTDAELGKLVNAASDETDFVVTIRERLRSAVASAIGDIAEDADVQAGRFAADELAKLLVARRRATSAGVLGRAGIRAVGHPVGSDEEVERRAAAFRTMAGVRT